MPTSIHLWPGRPGSSRPTRVSPVTWPRPCGSIRSTRASNGGVARYEGGRPLRITMDNDLGGLLFNTEKRPNRAGTDAVTGGGSFDPNTDNYFNKAAWTDPGPLQFGNAPRADGTVRGFKVYNEDVTIAKAFQLTTDLKM